MPYAAITKAATCESEITSRVAAAATLPATQQPRTDDQQQERFQTDPRKGRVADHFGSSQRHEADLRGKRENQEPPQQLRAQRLLPREPFRIRFAESARDPAQRASWFYRVHCHLVAIC